MAAARLSMRTIREILRLRWDHHLSKKQIAASCNIARSNITDYRHAADNYPQKIQRHYFVATNLNILVDENHR